MLTSPAIQGGDWGGIISRVMAQHYPQHIKALHVNFLPVTPPYPWRAPLRFLQSLLTIPFSARDKGYLASTLDYFTKGNGYLAQQQTRPQTLGYGLHDSPIALLAWLYDKLHSWTDHYPWTDDEILTWVCVYQFSAAGPAASVRIYYEAANGGTASGSVSTVQAVSRCVPSSVRLAAAQFPGELLQVPFAWYRAVGNVVRESVFEAGGHFAAWEVPELLAADLRSAFGRNGQMYAVVAGKDGY